MARGSAAALLVLAFLAFLLCASAGEVTASRGRDRPMSRSDTDFIKSSCRSTRYPALCVQCLSNYGPTVHHSPRKLAKAALSVSLDRARSASTFVTRLSTGGDKSLKSRETGAVRDCIETMNDSVDRLRKSVKEMNRLGRIGTPRFQWHYSNVQTWVSAALTDQTTCMDSFAGSEMDGGVKDAVREKVQRVTEVTSNALALVNRIGSNV